jgi:hypothetical protein
MRRHAHTRPYTVHRGIHIRISNIVHDPALVMRPRKTDTHLTSQSATQPSTAAVTNTSKAA